jgi:hypothetical protein
MRVAGVAAVPPDIRPDLGPIVGGLLGLDPATGLKVGPCALGQPLLIPVIAADQGSCPALGAPPLEPWPYQDTVAQWDEARVFTFVNITFFHIVCRAGAMQTPLVAANCNNAAFAQDCVGMPSQAGDLQLLAQINCNPPIATGGGTPAAVLPRLVR